MEKYTPRGFRNYAEFSDSYGSTITVRESSSAERHCVWVFCRKPTGEEFAPHLNKKQARMLIKALEKFINDK